MFPLSPLLAMALVGVAALLATRLPRPAVVTSLLEWSAGASPLGWFLLGLLIGPGLGVLDRGLLELCTPILACAVGWVAARAGAQVAIRKPAEWSVTGVAESAAAVLVPAVLLLAAVQWRLSPSMQEWKQIGPIVATLAAAAALAGTAKPQRLAAGAMLLATAALAALLLPHARGADFKRLTIWLTAGIGGAILCAGVAARLARTLSALPATIVALCLAAGIGMVSGASPLVVCGLMGFVLGRWSLAHARLAAESELHEATVAAVLWTLAGARIGGPLITVALGAVLVALWPLGRRLVTGASGADASLGLAIATNFTLVSGSSSPLAQVVPTIAALGLLLARVIPPRAPDRLTSPARRVEVSV